MAYQWLVGGARSDFSLRAPTVSAPPPLKLEPRSPIRLVTGLRPPPRPRNHEKSVNSITGPRLEYRVRLLWCWYVLSVRCAALEARVVGGLLSVRASLSVLAVSQDTGSHTKLTGNTGPTKEPVLPPSNPAGPFFY